MIDNRKTDRTPGTYWRVMWSEDWATRQPWSMDLEPMPYIGMRRYKHTPGVAMRTIGPLAIVSITITHQDLT